MAALRAIVALLGGYRAAAFALAAVLALGLAGLQTLRLSHAETALADARTLAAEQDAALAEARTRASEAARSEEQTRVKVMDMLARRYEKGKRDAEAAGKRVADDLRAGNLRLREQWRGCEASRVSGPTPGAGEPDAGAELRAEGARDLVRAAAEADEWIRALQRVTQADREQHPGRSE